MSYEVIEQNKEHTTWWKGFVLSIPGQLRVVGITGQLARVASRSLQLIVVFVLVVSGFTGLIVTAVPGIAAAANPSVTWTIQQSYLASASKLSSVSCPTSNDFWLSIWSVGAPNSAANCDISSDSWYCVGYTAGYNAASEMVWAAEHDTQGQAGAFLPSYAILESGRLRYWDMLSGCIAIH